MNLEETNEWMRRSLVAAHYGVDPATIARWSQTKDGFPKPCKIAGGVTAWSRTEIQEYDRSLREARD